MNAHLGQILLLIGCAAVIYYAGYRHGYHQRGVRHWRTFNRLVEAARQ